MAAPLPTESEVSQLRARNLHYCVAHNHAGDARRILVELEGGVIAEGGGDEGVNGARREKEEGGLDTSSSSSSSTLAPGGAAALVVNAPLDEGGERLLHVAADGGYMDCVELLLEFGAEVDVKEAYSGRTPLAYSLSQGKWEVARRLLEAGASGVGGLEFSAESGETPPASLKDLLA